MKKRFVFLSISDFFSAPKNKSKTKSQVTASPIAKLEMYVFYKISRMRQK